MKLVLTKAPGGVLVPVDQQAVEYLSKLKVGAGVTVEIKRHRNPGFHRKFFALLNLAYDAWEPAGTEYKGELVQKNFEQFRNDVTVLAGHFDAAITLKGDTRLTAKSISFANMEQAEFDRLYSSVIDVVLARVLTRYTRDDLDQVIEQLMRFAQ